MQRLDSKKICRYAFALGVILLATVLDVALDDRHKNMLLVAYICLSPLILLIRECRVILPRIDVPLLVFSVFAGISGVVWHPEHFRLGTYLFSVGFCVYFAMMARMLRVAGFTVDEFLKLLRIIIYAFTVVLLIQQFCVLTGLPVFNQTTVYGEPWKLDSLAREPSYMVTILSILIFFFGLISKAGHPDQNLLYNIRKNPWTWISYLWCLFTCYTASAYVALPLSLIPWIDRRNLVRSLGILVAVITACLIINNFIPSRQFSRTQRTVAALVTLDSAKIVEADLSASERIIPAMTIMKKLHVDDADFWLGHGSDKAMKDVRPTPLETETSPYIFNVWYNYGFLAELGLLWLIFNVCLIRRKPITWIISAAAFIYIAYNNCSAIWMILIFMMQYRVSVNPASPLLKPLQKADILRHS